MRLAVKETPVSYVDTLSSAANFLALRELFSRLPGDRDVEVLDMGPAWNSNLQFFSQFRTRLYIEDFYRWKQRSEKNKTGEKATELLQKYPEGTKFDVMLFWDLFEYINKKELDELITYLQAYCKKGTLLFFVTSTMESIPAQPAQFKILDAEHLSYNTVTDKTTPSRGYRQSGMKQLLPGFRLVRAFRMSTGVEENLYIYE